jgi:hypothetical protein
MFSQELKSLNPNYLKKKKAQDIPVFLGVEQPWRHFEAFFFSVSQTRTLFRSLGDDYLGTDSNQSEFRAFRRCAELRDSLSYFHYETGRRFEIPTAMVNCAR